ncbi:unnamed protein product, partial [Brachionus calyciflorus]
LERNLKKKLIERKINQLIDEFNKLKNFNQSENKHWKLIKKLENKDESNVKEHSITHNGKTIIDKTEISNLFADNLANIFTDESHRSHIPRTHIQSNDPPVCITIDELYNAIKNLNIKASPGFDNI